jgi:hypothetical protein
MLCSSEFRVLPKTSGDVIMGFQDIMRLSKSRPPCSFFHYRSFQPSGVQAFSPAAAACFFCRGEEKSPNTTWLKRTVVDFLRNLQREITPGVATKEGLFGGLFFSFFFFFWSTLLVYDDFAPHTSVTPN